MKGMGAVTNQLNSLNKETIVDATLQLRRPPNAQSPRCYHQLRATRIRLGVTVGEMATRLGISPSEVWRQEAPESDLHLSNFNDWSQALAVPVFELLIEQQEQMELVSIPPARLMEMAALADQMALTSKQAQDPGCANLATRLSTQLQQLSAQRDRE